MDRPSERKPLRADAARNVDKIITAARQCFRELGPEVPLQTIAATAGVGPATLFRNFADKEQLVLAALSRQLRLNVDPIAEDALAGMDAAVGLIRVIDAVVEVASEDANLLGAVAGRRGLLVGITGGLIDSMAELLVRGQGQGSLRRDISIEDMVRLVAMLIGAVDTMEPGSRAWERPVALLEDAIRTERPSRPLPPQTPIPGMTFEESAPDGGAYHSAR
ncbi:TetR/AcrR family transcriptional regulator [Arthrobacter sp. AZCC_0090]|uniref:TetR/AcrR family transcriptional regulator n=1 Tax=Arthrobacter sp. AZCC_0090 TaxID=2735881 RepID=UPI00161CF110|nr:TetR/AcrR family transcriptional regulator [Arthrobacter sp. AZCC_0090]MBB6406069.1 AcrR family transcriptional regulator [Arthrobacter sp. AZCC_0090]